jgi:D-hexose-6-phosphate mutarotase
MNDSTQWEIPGHLSLIHGEGVLPKAIIHTHWSSAEIYLQGAHVTGFQKTGEAPLLFTSAASEFAPGKPIRGGVPLIFPWFGPREGLPAHGFARTAAWDLKETAVLPDGAVTLRFHLPGVPNFQVEYLVTVAENLTLELSVENTADQDSTFETCLHTYFQISAIHDISITGLAGASYLDKVTNSEATEKSAVLRISSEIDRVYFDTRAAIEILDPGFKRKIRIDTAGSHSTVVWNPWIEKSMRLADFRDDEYLQMVCVESGNVAKNQITLPPGGHTRLKVEISSEKLA